MKFGVQLKKILKVNGSFRVLLVRCNFDILTSVERGVGEVTPILGILHTNFHEFLFFPFFYSENS